MTLDWSQACGSTRIAGMATRIAGMDGADAPGYSDPMDGNRRERGGLRRGFFGALGGLGTGVAVVVIAGAVAVPAAITIAGNTHGYYAAVAVLFYAFVGAVLVVVISTVVGIVRGVVRGRTSPPPVRPLGANKGAGYWASAIGALLGSVLSVPFSAGLRLLLRLIVSERATVLTVVLVCGTAAGAGLGSWMAIHHQRLAGDRETGVAVAGLLLAAAGVTAVLGLEATTPAVFAVGLAMVSAAGLGGRWAATHGS